jgi:antitoxin component HigA of HigAB toxin-antitoxin module
MIMAAEKANSIEKVPFKTWADLVRIIHVPESEAEYNDWAEFAFRLSYQIEQHSNPTLARLYTLITGLLSIYDDHIREPIEEASGVDFLKTLMEDRGLKQSDLKAIAPQSVISEILNGKRKMTRTHIEELAKFFNVSPAMFF